MKTYNLQSTRQRIRRRRTTVTGNLHRCALLSVSHFCPESRHRTLAIGRAGRSYPHCRRSDAKSFSQVALLHCSQTCPPCGSSSHCIGASHKCTLPSVTHFCPKSRHRTLAIGRAGRNHTLCRRRDAKSFSQVCALVHCSQTCLCLVGRHPTV